MSNTNFYDTSYVKVPTSALEDLEKVIAEAGLALIRGDTLTIKHIPRFLLKDKYCRKGEPML